MPAVLCRRPIITLRDLFRLLRLTYQHLSTTPHHPRAYHSVHRPLCHQTHLCFHLPPCVRAYVERRANRLDPRPGQAQALRLPVLKKTSCTPSQSIMQVRSLLFLKCLCLLSGCVGSEVALGRLPHCRVNARAVATVSLETGTLHTHCPRRRFMRNTHDRSSSVSGSKLDLNNSASNAVQHSDI